MLNFQSKSKKHFKKKGRLVDPVLPPLFPLVSFIKIELILLFPYGCAVLLGVAVASGCWDRWLLEPCSLQVWLLTGRYWPGRGCDALQAARPPYKPLQQPCYAELMAPSSAHMWNCCSGLSTVLVSLAVTSSFLWYCTVPWGPGSAARCAASLQLSQGPPCVFPSLRSHFLLTSSLTPTSTQCSCFAAPYPSHIPVLFHY